MGLKLFSVIDLQMKFFTADFQLAWASSEVRGILWAREQEVSCPGRRAQMDFARTSSPRARGSIAPGYFQNQVPPQKGLHLGHEYFTEHCYRLFPGTHWFGFEYICDIYLLQQKSHCYRFLYKYLMVSSHKLNLNNNSTNDIKAFHSFQKHEEKSKYLHTAF